MPGWRVGFMVGNPVLVNALARLKSYFDYGTFTPIQVASILALEGPQECVAEICDNYRSRRDVSSKASTTLGWPVAMPKATMFVWARSRSPTAHLGSLEFSSKLLLTKPKSPSAPASASATTATATSASPSSKTKSAPARPSAASAACSSTAER